MVEFALIGVVVVASLTTSALLSRALLADYEKQRKDMINLMVVALSKSGAEAAQSVGHVEYARALADESKEKPTQTTTGTVLRAQDGEEYEVIG